MTSPCLRLQEILGRKYNYAQVPPNHLIARFLLTVKRYSTFVSHIINMNMFAY